MLCFTLLSCWLLTATPGDSPTPEELSAYQAAAAKAGENVAAHIRLASWCELHGMQIERHKHLGIALELRLTIRPSTACSGRSLTMVNGECRRRWSKTMRLTPRQKRI